MIQRTKDDKIYHSYNGKSILSLPLQVPMGVSIIDFLSDVFKKYQKLVKEFNEPLIQFGIEDCDEFISIIKDICDNIILVHKEFLNGKTCHAYRAFHRLASKVEHITVDINSPIKFIRMRRECGLTAVSDFYHVPFDKVHLCNSQRFSIAGYPCLYIGYSLDVCKEEISKTGTYINLALKDHIKVVDLTWTTNKNTENPEETFKLKDFLKAWPLIAACYIVPFWCKKLEKQCNDIKENFKQEYIIPQLYTLYVKNNLSDINGIRYYTSRFEMLEYGDTKYMNIVLYPKYDKEKQSNYDMELIDKFYWESPIDLK